MRPVGKARMYVLATRATEEEDFARKRTRHLASKGVRVRERDSVAWSFDAGETTRTVDGSDPAADPDGAPGTDGDP
jgi:DNA excision repair protein ERCC-3